MRHLLPVSMLLALIALTGCGGYGDVAPVSGVVTLDGKPLPNAQITFEPVEGGRPSDATSDEQGNYTLKYTVDQNGAEIGKHLVRVTTSTSEDGPTGPIVSPELVPARYNADSDFTKVVTSSSNTIDLKLEGE